MTAGRYAMALGGGGRPMLRPFVSARGAHPQRTPRASCGPRPEAAGPSAGADRKGSIRISGADNAPGAGGGRGRAAAHGRGGPRGVGGLEAGAGGGRGDSPYQGYEVQRLARLVDHALPFSLLLLGVFIRQHLQESCWSEDDGESLIPIEFILCRFLRNDLDYLSHVQLQ
ncbi:hypothetical protein CFC21_052199 [Triticum aestivum]|uniref:Uncharacterized protein n=2 Tax=Triticum aestivum TaxID=4565 RepID=A0A9R1G9D9_WHEAT|nr:hypothetical protein CFC21_052199 [Triticum aestivum]